MLLGMANDLKMNLNTSAVLKTIGKARNVISCQDVVNQTVASRIGCYRFV